MDNAPVPIDKNSNLRTTSKYSDTSNTNRIANLILALILLIISLSSATIAYRRYISSKTSENVLLHPPFKPVSSPTDSFASWQTYTNEEYGFEFKYPGEWSTRLVNPDETDVVYGVLVNKTFDRSDFLNLNKPWMETQSIYPAFQIYIKALPFEDLYFEDRPYNCNLEVEGCLILFKYELITFQNLPARKATAEFPDYPELNAEESKLDLEGGLPYTHIVLNTNGRGWNIAFPHRDFKGTYDPIYDYILSTFRFLEK